MSSIYIQLKLVCANVLAAKQLKDNLAAFESMSDLNSSALTAVFAETTDLDTIRVDGIGAKKEVVSFDYQDSAQQGSLTSRQLQAWLELGVTFLHYEFCDSQTGLSADRVLSRVDGNLGEGIQKPGGFDGSSRSEKSGDPDQTRCRR